MKPSEQTSQEQTKLQVARSKESSLEELQEALQSAELIVKVAVAQNTSLAGMFLYELVDWELEVRVELASDPFTPVFNLQELALDESSEVRCAIDANKRILKKQLGNLRQAQERAKDPHTAPQDLESLTFHPLRPIRRSIADNPNAKPDLLAVLARDFFGEIRLAVARHKNTDLSALEELAFDLTNDVSCAARSHFKVSQSRLKYIERDIEMARNRNFADPLDKELEEMFFRKFLCHQNRHVLLALAQNTTLSFERFSQLIGLLKPLNFNANRMGLAETLAKNLTVSPFHLTQLLLSKRFPETLRNDLIFAEFGKNSASLFYQYRVQQQEYYRQRHQGSFWSSATAQELLASFFPALELAVASSQRLELAAAQILAGHGWWEVRYALANNNDCPEAVLKWLCLDSNVKVRDAAVGNWHIKPAAVAEEIQKEKTAMSSTATESEFEALRGDGNPNVRLTIVRNPVVFYMHLRNIYLDGMNTVQFATANNPSFPEDKLISMESWDDEEGVFAHGCAIELGLASRSQLSSETLFHIFKYWLPHRLNIVAAHESTYRPLVECLCLHSDEEVSLAALSNPMLNVSDVEKIMYDSALASSQKTPIADLEKLASHSNFMIRHAVAQNEAAPATVLKGLADDLFPNVKAAVALNPQTPIEILKSIENKITAGKNDLTGWKNLTEAILNEIASSPDLSLELLNAYSTSFFRSIRKGVASNPQCSLELLDLLSMDSDLSVRISVALNPFILKCPEILNRLAQDDENVRFALQLKYSFKK